MQYLRRRILAALTGVCAAIVVFSMAFAVSPSLIIDDSNEIETRRELYGIVTELTEEEMKDLQENYMDEDDLQFIKDTLVEATDVSIIMSYLQIDPDFETTLKSYVSQEGG